MKNFTLGVFIERYDRKDISEQEVDMITLDALGSLDNDTYCTTASANEYQISEDDMLRVIDVIMQYLDYDLHKECFTYLDEHEEGSEFHQKRKYLLSLVRGALI